DHQPTTSPSVHTSRNSSALVALGVGIRIGGAVVPVFVCVFLFGIREEKEEDGAPPPPHSSSSAGSEKHNSPNMGYANGKTIFTHEDLANATEGFSPANLLGQGGFGYVHKGVLPSGETVAIKLQRMLVYEFVLNNTFEFHLHGKGNLLDWDTRMKITLGSIKVLAYLHEDCQPKIVHHNIKSTNILLDSNFKPKVVDFGLARFTFDTESHVSTRVMGTLLVYGR
nr:proline-rich receptor-like protein kinase PERK1 [Tanacetum cinerariifolium]